MALVEEEMRISIDLAPAMCVPNRPLPGPSAASEDAMSQCPMVVCVEWLLVTSVKIYRSLVRTICCHQIYFETFAGSIPGISTGMVPTGLLRPKPLACATNLLRFYGKL